MIADDTIQDAYDCIVLGGGPAGSSAATLVAESGYSTLLLEREKMPRFHVGESLMPETYWCFQRLGVLDKMRDSKFVKKYSVQFVNGSGRESQPFFFKLHDPRECSQTWQVERAEFDKMLFDNASEKGAHCRDETRVLDVQFEGPRATGVVIRAADGKMREITCQVVVDGTGQQSLIANRLGLKEPIPNLRKIAIWTYYKNAARESGEHGGATIILHTESKDAWFWYIPLSNGITSVGLVGNDDYLLQGRGKPEEVYAEELKNCPALETRLVAAKQVEEIRVTKEFSYTTRQHAGPGWVLVGDAFGFLDPIYSSGVYFALKTGELAADAVVSGLREEDLSGESLGKWANEFKSGAQWLHKLVNAYYAKEFSFGRFMKNHPQHQSNLTDLLIGRIFHDGAGKIFDDLESAVSKSQSGKQ